MRFISTPAATVSKLKKAAKLASRNTSIVHAEALDLVARQAGYNHWKHVTECAEHTASDGKSALQRTAKDFAREHQPLKAQSFTVLIGPTGSGKSVHALDAALNSLRDGAPVDIIDVGRTYWALCQAIRGSYIEVGGEQSPEGEDTNNQGTPDLRVFELEPLLRAMVKDLKPASERFSHRAGLLVIDEAWRVSQAYELQTLIQGRLEAGGSVLVVIMGDGKEPWVEQLCNVETSPEVWRTVMRLAHPGGRTRSESQFRARNQQRELRPDEPTVADIQALNGRQISTLNADERRVYDFYRRQGEQHGVVVYPSLDSFTLGSSTRGGVSGGGEVTVLVELTDGATVGKGRV